MLAGMEASMDGQAYPLEFRKQVVAAVESGGLSCNPGDIVIMDNLGSHKGKAVRQLIRSAGAKPFFLPKYSPDLNPIEQLFAKLKHLLRKAAARTPLR
jgi:transposase